MLFSEIWWNKVHHWNRGFLCKSSSRVSKRVRACAPRKTVFQGVYQSYRIPARLRQLLQGRLPARGSGHTWQALGCRKLCGWGMWVSMFMCTREIFVSLSQVLFLLWYFCLFNVLFESNHNRSFIDWRTHWLTHRRIHCMRMKIFLLLCVDVHWSYLHENTFSDTFT